MRYTTSSQTPTRRVFDFIVFGTLFFTTAIFAAGPACYTRDLTSGDPSTWFYDWGYSSRGNANKFDGAASNIDEGIYQICAGAGCGSACCWRANYFAFSSSAGDTCNITINFNGDSRNYNVVTSSTTDFTMIGVDGFMANEGNWVTYGIYCNYNVVNQWTWVSPNSPASIPYQGIGGKPTPPIPGWQPGAPPGGVGTKVAWTAFAVSPKKCGPEQLCQAYQQLLDDDWRLPDDDDDPFPGVDFVPNWLSTTECADFAALASTSECAACDAQYALDPANGNASLSYY